MWLCVYYFAGMIANDLSCSAPAKFAFLELADPSQLDWVLSLNNWPIPHCPTVSQLSCDFSVLLASYPGHVGKFASKPGYEAAL